MENHGNNVLTIFYIICYIVFSYLYKLLWSMLVLINDFLIIICNPVAV